MFFQPWMLHKQLTDNPDLRKRYVGLVGCSKIKSGVKCKARRMYKGSFTKDYCARWVERNCDQWYYLSSKYIIAHPDDILEPYDEYLSNIGDKVGWANDVLDTLSELAPGRNFILVSSSVYYEPLKDVIPNLFYLFKNMIEKSGRTRKDNFGIGYMKMWLRKNPIITTEVDNLIRG